MKSLDDFNKQQRAKWVKSNDPQPNGIACPECGHELVDSRPMIVLDSYPPQLEISCPTCNYKGYRVK